MKLKVKKGAEAIGDVIRIKMVKIMVSLTPFFVRPHTGTTHSSQREYPKLSNRAAGGVELFPHT
jgi:hypothetical protein